ncbi:MAG: formate dehydrogenase accessory sulfurtransferase FdhD [Candidatus Atabeyarchaeum deiterrae]
MKNIRRTKIVRIKEGNPSVVDDEVIVDTFLSVSLNGKHITSFICSSGFEEEAAIGYLFSTGILSSFSLVKKTSHKGYDVDVQTMEPVSVPDLNATLITSACGVPEEWLKLKKGFKLPKVESDLRVKSTAILSAMRQLNESSEIFRKTGGTHAAALFKQDATLIFSVEDVNRHVAIDKVIGKALMMKTDLLNSFLASTGRLASDMVVKAVYASIPVVASIAAPFISGIQLAETTGITLIGFVRGERMNVYSHPERITPD